MTYTEIENAINEGLENDRKEYRVKFDKVMKNGITHNVFRLKNESRIEPIYYIQNDLTEGFIYGDIVKELDLAYITIPEMPSLSKEFVMKNLRKGLCPQDRREEFIRNGVYYEEWNDLYIYFYFKIFEGGTVKITKNLMKEYNIDISEVCKTAKESKNANIIDMFDFLKNNTNIEIEQDEEDPLLLIVTNKEMTNGAGEILTDYALSKLYRSFKGAFYVLPSSVHEVIAVKAISEKIEDLKSMVRFVNNTELKPEEKLSDNVYYCDETLELRLA